VAFNGQEHLAAEWKRPEEGENKFARLKSFLNEIPGPQQEQQVSGLA